MLLVALMAMVLLVACREEQFIFVPEEVEVTLPEYTSLQGFYLLNEGNMNSNKATLDYYNFRTGPTLATCLPLLTPMCPRKWATWEMTWASMAASYMPSLIVLTKSTSWTKTR